MSARVYPSRSRGDCLVAFVSGQNVTAVYPPRPTTASSQSAPQLVSATLLDAKTRLAPHAVPPPGASTSSARAPALVFWLEASGLQCVSNHTVRTEPLVGEFKSRSHPISVGEGVRAGRSTVSGVSGAT